MGKRTSSPVSVRQSLIGLAAIQLTVWQRQALRKGTYVQLSVQAAVEKVLAGPAKPGTYGQRMQQYYRHTSEFARALLFQDIADQACIPHNTPLSQRDQAIHQARNAGLTYRQIAKRFGISRSRAHQIVTGQTSKKR